MATYVISDIHGDLDRWNEMKNKIRFSENDKMIIIGDVIDRGNDGITILKEVIGTKNMHLLMGNHELMMLEAEINQDPKVIDNWINNNGGYTTARALYDDPHGDDLLEYIRTKVKIKARTMTKDGRMFYLAHAFVNGPEFNDVIETVWHRAERDEDPNLPDGILICGHTPVINLYTQEELRDSYYSHCRILHAPYYINIDCGCGHKDKRACLSCLRLDDMAEFYVK